jgi:hypothetical protein
VSVKHSLAFCTVILTVSTYATAFDPYELYDLSPEGDLLVSDGRKMRVETIPFAQYFEMHPEARSATDVIVTHGQKYSAIWEFGDSMLYLTDAFMLRSMPDRPDTPEVMEAVMPELFSNQERVFADWYTGYLIIPTGDREVPCYSECPTVAEHYTVFAVLHGMMKQVWTMPGDAFCEFWQSQYQAFQQSQEYARFFSDELEHVKQFRKQKQPGMPVVAERDSMLAEDFLRTRQFGHYMSIIRDTLMDK